MVLLPDRREEAISRFPVSDTSPRAISDLSEPAAAGVIPRAPVVATHPGRVRPKRHRHVTTHDRHVSPSFRGPPPPADRTARRPLPPGDLQPVTVGGRRRRQLARAIIAANANGQDNTINLQAGTYQLTLANNGGPEDAAATGDLDLTSAGHTITIVGQGAGSTIVNGGGLDRVFQIMRDVTATIQDLTIQHGIAQASMDSPDLISEGGGVNSDGTTELDGVVVQDCVAKGPIAPPCPCTSGGGIDGGVACGGGIAEGYHGSLTLNECIIRDNSAVGGQGNAGNPDNTYTPAEKVVSRWAAGSSPEAP